MKLLLKVIFGLLIPACVAGMAVRAALGGSVYFPVRGNSDDFWSGRTGLWAAAIYLSIALSLHWIAVWRSQEGLQAPIWRARLARVLGGTSILAFAVSVAGFCGSALLGHF